MLLSSLTLVFVHGAGGGGWEWEIWRRVAEARACSVIAPDLQADPAGLEQTGLDDYQAQVSKLLESHPDCVLIGASLGGLLVLRERCSVRARIAVNPLVPQSMGGENARAWPDRVEWRRSSLQSSVRSLSDGSGSAALYAHQRWRDESGRVLREAHCCPVLPVPIEPTLIMAAQNDVDVPPAAMRDLADALDADYLSIAKASHLGPLLGNGAAASAALALAWLECRLLEPS